MGKHDIKDPSTVEFYKAEAERQKKRAEFAEDLVRQLRETVGRLQKWANEIEANAEDKITELEAENAKLRGKILTLVDDYVGRA